MEQIQYSVTGHIVNRASKKGIKGLQVEAWGKDLLLDDFVGKSISDGNGNFTIEFTDEHVKENFLDRHPDLFFKVFKNGELIHSTEDSILWNIQTGDTAVSIEIDVSDELPKNELSKNELPEKKLPEKKFIVKGHITQSNGKPLLGLSVRAFDKDMRYEQLLGEAQTGNDGYYEIVYSPDQFRRAEKAQADLVLRLFTPKGQEISSVNLSSEDGTPLQILSYTDPDGSPIRISVWFNAPPVAVINGIVTDAKHQGLSEYERNLGELAPLLENQLPRNLLDSDLQFLVGETGLAYEQIDFLRRDDGWAYGYNVEPAIFYGLLRQNLSTDLRQLLAEKPSRWRSALKTSLAANIIPAHLSDQLDSSLERLTQIAIEMAFTADPNAPNNVPLGVKLASSSLSPEVQRQVIAFVQSYDGEDVWQALEEGSDLEPLDLSEIRFTLDSDTLLMGHLATLQSVQQLKQSRNWQDARNLAQLTRSDWEQLAASTTSNGLPNGFETSQNYANAIADRIEQTYATDVFKYRLAADNESAHQDVITFLDSNPDFDLLRTSIDTFLTNGAVLGNINDVKTLPAKLKTFSRIARVTPDRDRYQLTQELIRQGYDSSMKIAGVGQAEFIGKMMPIAGSSVARQLHETARARTDAANMHLLRIRDYVTDFIPVVPRAKPTGELAEWTRLFGSLNSCQCKPCRSVYSSAAYLVDMLEFLKKTCINRNLLGACTQNLQQVLFARRPDLRNLKLDCDNSNTPIPHIDLVNELLELQVAPVPPAAASDGWPYQTVGSTEEEKAKLRAIPAHEHRPAYETLASAAYPWLLPFDLNHERSLAFAKYLNITLWEIRQLFNRNEQEIARFFLGFNQRLWNVVTTAEGDLDRLAGYWGLNRIADWATREPVPAVLKRSGLSYQDLSALLETHYLAGRGLSLDSSEDPCNINNHFLVRREGMPSVTWYLLLDRLHRLLRLRHALGWPIEKLDTLLHLRGIVDITAEAMTDIVRIIQLAQRLRLSEIQVAQLNSDKLAAVLRTPPVELQRYIRLFNLGELFLTVGGSSEIRLDPTRLIQFLDTYDRLQQTSFDAAELLYLLNHEDMVPSIYTMTESKLKSHLDSLIQALKAVDPAPLGEAPTDSDAEATAFIESLSDNLTEGERRRAVDSFLRQRMDIFNQRLRQCESAVIQHFESGLGLDADLLQGLLGTEAPDTDGEYLPAVLHSFDRSDRPAIADFTELMRTAAPAEDTVNRAKRMMIRLAKAARLIQNLHLTCREMKVGSDLAVSLAALDFNILPAPLPDEPTPTTAGIEYANIETWIKLKQLQVSMPRDDRDIFDFLAEAYRAGTTSDAIVNLISTQTGWDIDPRTGESVDTIEPLQNALGDVTVPAFQQIRTYEKLNQAIQWMHKEKLTPLEIITLGTGSVANIVSTLAAKAEAQYAGKTLSWYKALTSVSDPLRERKRDALVAYLLANPALKERIIEGDIVQLEPAWRDTNGLYAYFLIDTEMSACQMTSRIVQAHSAVQLFVQRCRMNLEQPEVLLGHVTDSDHWQQWEWMKNYRVWEAARKVFLYPENWIEPDLRDNKSPFFEALENELLQDDVTEASVERAYRNYFVRLDQVSRLDVRGLYEEVRANGAKFLHLVARTYSEPYVYFYRKRLPDRMWTAWEKIDLSIEGDHLLPAMVGGRLMLFWITFREIQPNGSAKRWEITLQWSEYEDGRWQAQRNANNKLIRPLLRKEDFSLRLDSTSQGARVLLYEQVRLYRGDALESDSYSVASDGFLLDPCKPSAAAITLSPQLILLHPDRTGGYTSNFLEDQSPGDAFNVNIGLIADQTIEGFDATLPRTVMELVEHGGPGGAFLALVLAPAFAEVANQIRAIAQQTRQLPVLQTTPGQFSVVTAHQFPQFMFGQPLFYAVEDRSYLASTRHSTFSYSASTNSSSTMGSGATWPLRNWLNHLDASILFQLPQYEFETFYHPYICVAGKALLEQGLNGLLAAAAPDADFHLTPYLHRQLYREPAPRFRHYRPTELVRQNHTDPYSLPHEQFDFSFDGAYSIYNWELFFHIPLLVADRLSKNQRFAQAQRWFHYIFDPTDISQYQSPEKFWQIKPFFAEARRWSGPTETLEEMLHRLATGAEDVQKQIEAWRNDPFSPHLIARLRPVAYMKTVVQKYLENCIAWGDYLFRQDTRESINEAVQLYVLAAEILGPRPMAVSGMQDTPRTYSELEPGLDAFANVLIDIDTNLPAIPVSTPAVPGTEIPPDLVLYFCIPSNEKLLGYWDTIADRIFKIRNCMDIEGQVRPLPLLAPPIDPALLVRARAAGLDLGQAINGALDLQLPNYRFQILMQKALEFCNDVKAFGGALLAALEKKDAEDLSTLRASHEVAMLKLIAQVKLQQIDEARETLEGLKASRKLAEKRLEFYSGREFMNAAETSQVVNLGIAHGFQTVGQGLESAASFSFLIPDTKGGAPSTIGTTFGGTNIGNALKAGASVANFIASQFSFAANMSSIIGGYERRRDDWNLQADLAAKELQQIDKQILAAEIRLAIAELDKANQEKQIEQAGEVESFLKTKFTNGQLYSWMISQVSALHFQAYRMAFDLAKKGEKAAQHELGLRAREFDHIQFGHWESQRKGLLACERLQQDLRRMDLAYLDKNARNYELTRHISLRQLDPVALLRLKARYSCEFTVPEWLFDLDHPGHYMRRIRNVSLSVPAVSGPYTGINCTLSLLKSTLRRSSDIGSAYQRAAAEDNRFEDYYGRIQSIVTSSAQNDSGLFDTNLRDERFLPFEGAGAESTWKLELPAEFRRFDYDTISDVILHVRYTAKEGGAALKREATEHLKQLLNPPAEDEQQQRLFLIFSLRHDFPTQWHHFASGIESFVATVRRDYFPYFVQGKRITLQELELYENNKLQAGATEALNPAVLTEALQNDNAFDVPLTLTVPDGNAPLYLLVKYTVR